MGNGPDKDQAQGGGGEQSSAEPFKKTWQDEPADPDAPTDADESTDETVEAEAGGQPPEPDKKTWQ